MTLVRAPLVSAPRALPAPAAPEHPCRVWSAHAEDLALALAAEIAAWPESPVQRLLAARGHLVLLREGSYVPASALASMAARAVVIGCALGTALRGSFVIAGPSAAWVLAGGPCPSPIALLSTARPVVLAGVVMRQAPLPARDVESIGGCPLTVPERSATDALRFEALPECALSTVRSLRDAGLLDDEEVERRLRRLDGHPHARRARERWSVILRADGASDEHAGRSRAAGP